MGEVLTLSPYKTMTEEIIKLITEFLNAFKAMLEFYLKIILCLIITAIIFITTILFIFAK